MLNHQNLGLMSSHINFDLWVLSMIDILYEPLHSLRKTALFVVSYGCYWIYCPIAFHPSYLHLLLQILQIHCGCISFVG